MAKAMSAITAMIEYSAEETADEIERVIYGFLSEELPIKQAVLHDQYDLEFNDDCRMRVREELDLSTKVTTHTLTVKTPRAGGGDVEVTQVIEQDVFLALAKWAHRRWRKARWTIPFTEVVDGVEHQLNWEIDRSFLPDDTFHPLVKIDIEVPSTSVVPTSLPSGVTNMIDASFDQELSDEQEETIDDLFDKVIIHINE